MDERGLKELPLFSGLGRRERKRIAPLVEQVEVEEGREIVRQGEVAHELFVIEEGTARVSRDGAPVADLGPGDFFGEIALLDEERRRTSTVVATSPMRLAVLHGRHVRVLDRELPEVSSQIHAAIEQRRAADSVG
ncbi:MAG TPA: cyclic nucleotide-binding domain-containing protein [Solirubrobacteraceae bacterium]|nr:cyclic nucleotide-binding domain-containing protein [Solirubrobacteraceae bacterium]